MLFAIWAAASIGTAPPPIATTPARGTADYDVHCLLVAQAAAGMVDAASKDRVGLIIMFYFGRVDASIAGDAVKRRMRSELSKLRGPQIPALLQDCSQFMNQRSQAMDAIRHQLAPLPAKPGK